MLPSNILLVLALFFPLTSASMRKQHPNIRPAQHMHDRTPINGIANSNVESVPIGSATPESSQGKVMVRRKKRGCVAGTAPSVASPTIPPQSLTVSSASLTSTTATVIGTVSTNSTGSLLERIFPMGTGSASWTTCTDSSSSLSYSGALNPLTAGKLPNIAISPDGHSSLLANYPSGTFQLSATQGFNFYTEGSKNSVLVEVAKEVMLSYSVYFQSGFQFNKGGKMPGLYGGTSLTAAKSCSGGRQEGRDDCFSARLMWRTNGAGEFYNYYPTSITEGGTYCSTPPYSICDTVYGDSIGRGAFTWPTGAWITVAQRLKLNDVGAANGEQELFVNGVSVIKLLGLEISMQSSTKIYGIMAQTFFGGNDATWASPQDQSAWFKDWSLAVLA
ncbi:MAG: hypothetical protein TREMPRED_002788 [Tremellales sp. Tagirdzhanova-0007]|nr:MAG: hypothetical protein TREMPRED_002788 [Tremellales sp. Tagirdzhanova-0007]